MNIRWLHPGRLVDGFTGECQWDNVAPSAPMPTPSVTAGGGGDPAPQSDAPTTETAQPEPAASEPEPEDEVFSPVTPAGDSDDDAPAADLATLQSKYRALRKDHRRALRRLERQNIAAGVLQGKDIRQVVANAQAYENISAAVERNPKLRALLYGEDQAHTGQAHQGDAGVDVEELPFDTSDPVGRFFAERIKRDAETIKALTSRLDAIEGRTAQSAAQAEARTWKDAVAQAASQLPAEYREMFSDAVYGGFKEAKSRRIDVKPQQIIDHYLKRLNVSKGQQARASAAAAQTIAEANHNLPKRPAGTGTPASARPGGESVADVNRRLRKAFG